MKYEKRPRAQNWDVNEKIALILNIRDHVAIIENKTKQTVSNKTKEEAWKAIQESMKVEGFHREIPRLKEGWIRLKTQAKKNISTFNKLRKQTGGGPAPTTEPWEFDYIIKEMIPYEFEDDTSIYDSEGSLSVSCLSNFKIFFSQQLSMIAIF